MKINKTKKKGLISDINQESDHEMAFYLKKKGLGESEVSEYESLRSFLHSHYISTTYSFGPYFVEGVSSRLMQMSGRNLILDFTVDLSKFFTRVATLAFLVLIVMLIYTYVTHGNISGILDLDPERLNDTRLISSILSN